MPEAVLMPKMGWTMTEGTIERWLKAEGDTVAKGEPILEIQTDKVTMDVEAPASGTLAKIVAGNGKTVPVVSVIGYILRPGETPPTDWSSPGSEDDRDRTEHAAVGTGQRRATPVAKRIAREHGIDIAAIAGSGDAGSITKQDVLDALAKQSSPAAEPDRPRIKVSPRARRAAREHGIVLDTVTGTGPEGSIIEDDVLAMLDQQEPEHDGLVVPSQMQQVAARRLTESFTSVPHFYLTTEVDATRLIEWRESLLAPIEAETGVRLTFTDLLVRLIADTLVEHPLANASWEDGGVRLAREMNVGIAVEVDDGLIVPVIRRADTKSIADIAATRHTLVDKARSGRLTLEDLEGGTFTFSNLGMFDIDDFQPIINPPQSAILAAGRIAERPVVENGTVVARSTLRLTLACDHRVIDGAKAARFLGALKHCVEAASDSNDSVNPQS